MNATIENLLGQLQSPNIAALALDTLLKSFLVLALAWAVCAAWRGASSATRHLIWFLAVAVLPLLPLLHIAHPAWQKPVWAISQAGGPGNANTLALEFAPSTVAASALDSSLVSGNSPVTTLSAASAQFNVHWLSLAWAVWLAGAVVLLIRMLAGQVARRRFFGDVQSLTDAGWQSELQNARHALQLRRSVTLLQASGDVMPVTWGWLRPVVVMPAEAADWDSARRRVVLLHELAHIKRGDYATQILAQMICAVFWFNPLAWLAARQMCVEREGACDDLVLAGGCKASEYAGHLVDIAGSFRPVPNMTAIAMARSSQLHGRIAAIVDTQRNRRLHLISALAVLAVIGSLTVCFGGDGTSAAPSGGDSAAVRKELLVRLKAFAKQKEKQSEELAAASGETITPEYRKFFKAALDGDAQTVTNLFESFKNQHPQYSHPNHKYVGSLRTSYWSPVLELCLAYADFAGDEPIYTKMAADGIIDSIPAGSIYFGGTDPGRGLPTAFAKSHVNADPFYTLTQNALADGTYLEYLDRTYGTQRPLLGRLAAACRADAALNQLNDKYAQAVKALESLTEADAESKWDDANQAVQVLADQRTDRVHGLLAELKSQGVSGDNSGIPATIYIATMGDSQACFMEYSHQKQLTSTNNPVKISGQVDVMNINALIAKVIFDKNPDRDFYIEESFPLDWMYPHLEPHGLIMKINRQPLTEMSEATVQADLDYWQPRLTQMIGGWLKQDTSVTEVAAFVEKVYGEHDLDGFMGDPRFVGSEWAGKLFSKLRSSMAGVYAWRADHAATDDEKKRMAAAADFSFRQAWALCPYSPEAVYRYVTFLCGHNRNADALLLAETALQVAPKNYQAQFQGLVDQLKHQKPGKKSASNPVSPAKPDAAGKAPAFQLRLVADQAATNTEEMAVMHPKGSGASSGDLNVDKDVLLDQSALATAKLDHDDLGQPVIIFSLNDNGKKQFADITREHKDERLAIIMDGKVVLAPTIREEITSGNCQVRGSFDESEALALVDKLQASIGR